MDYSLKKTIEMNRKKTVGIENDDDESEKTALVLNRKKNISCRKSSVETNIFNSVVENYRFVIANEVQTSRFAEENRWWLV